ncbi:restriction endonuclease subunit S [Mammaliicoccus sp. H-M33]|uniref:restriction endonuclease subunit S n=1 Tax=Mammaliicoccus sp. H-M33 TaxID=2898692 RepID=UPI001EFAB405|nr:restriction endonuclease subunit S [Mammaliicoccus sp. H-M33]
MANEVKNVPELRFPEFRNEWEDIKFENIFQEVSNKTGDLVKNPLFSLTVENGITPKSDRYKRDFLVKKNDNFKIVEPNNIVYNPMNVTLGAIDLSNYNYNLAVSGYYHVLKIINNFNVSFVANFLKTNRMITHYKKIATGTLIEKQRVHFSEFKNIIKKFPSIKEQQKIGDFFSKLDRQIELEEQKLAKLEEQKKGYMQKIFSQELRFKDEKGNEYPEWEEKKLGDILERGNKDKVNEIGKYRRLTISLHGKGLYEVKQERKTKDTRPFYQRFEGELIIGKQNFFNGSIAIVTREFNGFICSNAIMSYKISNHMNRKYLLEYLLQNDFLRKNEYLADGTGQKELSEKKFEELEIKLPNSINEQQKIGVFLERLDNLIEKQSNKLELLKQRKKSFLQKMFV